MRLFFLFIEEVTNTHTQLLGPRLELRSRYSTCNV